MPPPHEIGAGREAVAELAMEGADDVSSSAFIRIAAGLAPSDGGGQTWELVDSCCSSSIPTPFWKYYIRWYNGSDTVNFPKPLVPLPPKRKSTYTKIPLTPLTPHLHLLSSSSSWILERFQDPEGNCEDGMYREVVAELAIKRVSGWSPSPARAPAPAAVSGTPRHPNPTTPTNVQPPTPFHPPAEQVLSRLPS